MKPVNPKHRGLVARMAGNIVGGIIVANNSQHSLSEEILPGSARIYAREAVRMAMAIIEEVEAHVPCGTCDECKSGNQCRELPGETE